MQSSRAASRYVCGALRIEPLGVLTLVYHRASGTTHFVAEPVPQILAALTRPMDAVELAGTLAADFDFEGEDGVAVIAARLDELAALGLVTRDA